MCILSIIGYVVAYVVTYALVVYAGYKLFIEDKGDKK